MSIYAVIDAHVEAGRLHRIVPLPMDPVERHMFVSNDIKLLLEGPWETTSIERRANRLRADLEAFVKGDPIPVSMTPHKHRTAYMGLLNKPEHQIWDIRSRDPDPGLRVFGRFAETDVFVGLTWRPRSTEWINREPLGDGRSLEWELEKLECEEAWTKLFPNHPAKCGADLRDYISAEAFLV